ncbi:MAG TPA: 5-formyltetrahydrofolate cyclo-ligase [Patescibacteria group bacterium]|nr:5-formyltetrahydrofolate cyclo-ligase [Patescibacteria group bacterium]
MLDSHTAKDSIRKGITLANRRFTPHERKRADDLITKRLIHIPLIINANVVCSYVSLPDEVDTKKIITALLLQKKTVVVPKVISKSVMSLYKITTLDDLAPGVFHILEPRNTGTIVPISTIDLFIVPGIAFDRQGNRLGRGRGYYDRLLRDIAVPKIGLAYDFQVIAEVPHSSYDVRVTAIVTELKTIKISRGE